MIEFRAAWNTCFAAERVRPCYGRTTLHHIIPKQRIKRAARSAGVWAPGKVSLDLKAAVHDERNLIPVCFGCHQLVEGGRIRVENADLPAGFWNFVEEYQLAPSLPRHLSARQEAA